MWCNFSNEESIGSQPIRVFRPDTFREFNKIKYSLHSWFPKKSLDEVILDYKTGKNNLIGPYATKGLISLDETFLSAF
jgi:hypothetical protein